MKSPRIIAILYTLFIIAGCFIYFVLKGAAGHGFIFYWYEILSAVIALLSPISMMALIFTKSQFFKRASLLLTFIVIIAAIAVSIYFFTYRFGSDIEPLFIHIPVLIFLCLSGYSFYAVLKDKLIYQ